MSKRSNKTRSHTLQILFLAGLAGFSACRDEPLSPRNPAATRQETADAPIFYYYDHKPVYLTVDPANIVVATSSAVASDPREMGALTRSLLSSIGARVDSVARVSGPPYHWVLKLLPSNAFTTASIRARLATDARFKAVLPMYRSRDGNAPVIVLNRVVARFKPEVSLAQVQKLAASLDAVVVRPPVPDSGYVTYILEPRPGSSTDALKVANAIDENSLAMWASPDMIRPSVHPMSVPTDTYFPYQYYLNNSVNVLNGVPVDIDAERAWDITKGNGSVRIVFIDTGVDALHPEFTARGNTMIGFDLMSHSGVQEPGEWAGQPYSGNIIDEHGTAVAGIALAAQDGVGTAGIAPNASFDAVRIFRNGLVASDNDIANGITWAAAHGDVLNNSWGDCGVPSFVISNAVANALSTGRGGKGAVVVFSAGNVDPASGCSLASGQTWESRLAGVISVSALTRTGALASYSLTGPSITVSAFGGPPTAGCLGADLFSTILHYNHICHDPIVTTAYTTSMGGTSGAAPMVSGVVALLLSREPTLTAAQVKSRIMANADIWGAPVQFGAGKLNAFRTLFNFVVHLGGPVTIRSPGTYTWSVSPSGGTGTYSYLWQESDDNGTTWSNAGSTSQTYSRHELVSETFLLRALVTSGSLQLKTNELRVTVTIGDGGK